MHRNGNGDGSGVNAFLHDAVTPALANLPESLVFEDLTNLSTRENPELTQPAPRPG
jgi:hypothetical protein